MKNGSLLIFALLFIFSNSIFAATIVWDGDTNSDWHNASNWVDDVLPGAGDKVKILISDAVIISANVSIIGLHMDGGSSLTINTGFTLTTTGNSTSGSDGVAIRTSSSLTINGTLNISGCTGDGLDIDKTSSVVTVESNGKLIINNVGDGSLKDGEPEDHGIEITGAFSNYGVVTIDSPDGGDGIRVTSSQTGTIINNNGGSITISGTGRYGISINSGKSITNNGTVTISDAGSDIFIGSGDFINGSSGIFKGDGIISGAGDFVSQSGSTIAPGTSPGTLTVNASEDILFNAGVTFDIEIDGTIPGTDYDQIVTNNDVNITGSTLTLSGGHTPVSGNVFTIFDVPAGMSVIGTFNGIAEGGTVTLNGETLYISYVGGPDLNDITFVFDAPLPVELVDFSASALDNEIKLSWITASEINNDYFTLERSVDGRNFEEIAMILGNGNATEISKYIHMDENPERGLSYYRLKQTDYDGQFSYSDIETVTYGKDNTIKIYPTMVANVLTVETGSDLDGELTIIIRDLTGRQYESFIIQNKSNREELSLTNLSPGSYFISIYNNDTIETHKFIKL